MKTDQPFLGKRWFAGKDRRLVSTRVIDSLVLPDASEPVLQILEVSYADAAAERYTLCRGFDSDRDPTSLQPLAGWIQGGGPLLGTEGGVFEPEPFAAPPARVDGEDPWELGGDQSNSLAVCGGALLKVYRLLWPGTHPEPELLDLLAGSGVTPRLYASLRYRDSAGSSWTLATLQEYLPGLESGWEGPIASLKRLLEDGDLSPSALDRSIAEFAAAGATTGTLHRALAAGVPLRAAEPDRQRRWSTAGVDCLEEVVAVVGDPARTLLLDRLDELRRRITAIEQAPRPLVGRVHGDLHYGQFLRDRERCVVIDFEGDPTTPLAERRQLTSPARDLASLLRSFDHIASAAARRTALTPEESEPRIRKWLHHARRQTCAAYARSAPAALAVPDPTLLHAFELVKECGEFIYAQRFLPDWEYAPRAGIERLLAEPQTGERRG